VTCDVLNSYLLLSLHSKH